MPKSQTTLLCQPTKMNPRPLPILYPHAQHNESNPGSDMIHRFESGNRRYEWDPEKAQSNLEKHGINFASVASFEWSTTVIRSSARHGETRFVAYGYIGTRLHSLAFTIRRDRIRIISFRKADLRERQYYAQAKT